MHRRTPDHVTVTLTCSPAKAVRLGAVVHAGGEEAFCGLFERVVDGHQNESWKPGLARALDLRGQKITMTVRPTVSLYTPFYLSSAGYGVCVDGTWPGVFDMAATRPDEVAFRFEGPELRFHVLRGATPLAILRQHRALTGLPVLPPRWVFTPWRWRDDHVQRDAFFDGTPYAGYFNVEVVEDILMMEALGIPCGVYWVDRPWAKGRYGYEDFEWDAKRLPHIEEMIQWLSSRRIRFALWIAPWVLGDMVKEGERKKCFLPSSAPKSPRRLIDFTNPGAVTWWQGYLKKVIDQGVVGFKLDRSEEIVPGRRDVLAHSGMTTREMRNDYPRLYTEAVFRVLKRERGDDFAIMPRAGYTGSWRYAIFWGGDTSGSQWGLRSAIVAVQRAAVMGFTVWGADTGGYHRGYNRETLLRWLAFSAFCPLMEVGPTANKGLWNCPWNPGYDVEVLAAWRLYARVHHRIGDYLHRCAKHAHETGEPIVRPLFVQFPGDAECVKWWDEYMLGEDILVCPIWKTGVTRRQIYLPAGKWRDAWEPDRVVTGPGRIEVACPLHRIPVHVRAGAEVDVGDLAGMYEEALKAVRKKPDLEKLLRKAGLR